MTAHTISLAELEARVPDATDVELPGPEGGWATATINGHFYRALVAPVPIGEINGAPVYVDPAIPGRMALLRVDEEPEES